MNVPENLRFTEEHEWIRMDGDIAYIGITAHAADQLGELVYLEVETPAKPCSRDMRKYGKCTQVLLVH